MDPGVDEREGLSLDSCSDRINVKDAPRLKLSPTRPTGASTGIVSTTSSFPSSFSFIHACPPNASWTSPSTELLSTAESVPPNLPTNSHTTITASDLGHLLSTKKRKTRRANAPVFACPTLSSSLYPTLPAQPLRHPASRPREIPIPPPDSFPVAYSGTPRHRPLSPSLERPESGQIQQRPKPPPPPSSRNPSCTEFPSAPFKSSPSELNSIENPEQTTDLGIAAFYLTDGDTDVSRGLSQIESPVDSPKQMAGLDSTMVSSSFSEIQTVLQQPTPSEVPQSSLLDRPRSTAAGVLFSPHLSEPLHSSGHWMGKKVTPTSVIGLEKAQDNRNSHHESSILPLTEEEEYLQQQCLHAHKSLSAWDVMLALADAFRKFASEIDESISQPSPSNNTNNNSHEKSLLNMIRKSLNRIEELKSLQNEKVKEENFGDAELLDEELKKLKGELVLLDSSASFAFDRVLELQSRLVDKFSSKIIILDKCISDLRVSRGAVLEEARKLTASSSARWASDTDRLKFECDRLHLEFNQIVTHFSHVDLELKQVEETIDNVTCSDAKERQLAVDKKKGVDAEIERLQQLLAALLEEQHTLEQNISEYDIRIAAARSKFKKQLSRLETSRESLVAAKRECVNERTQMQHLKTSVWSARQEVGQQLNRLLSEVSTITIGIPILNRCIRIPLLITLRLKEDLINRINEVSLDSMAVRKQLTLAFNKTDSIRSEIESINQVVTQLKLEESAIEQQITFANSHKATAIASRLFREAGKLTTEIKELEEKEQTVNQEILCRNVSVQQLSQALVDQEKEEEHCRKEVERQNHLRALAMVKVMRKHQQKMSTCLVHLEAYCRAMQGWLRKAEKGERKQDQSILSIMNRDEPVSWSLMIDQLLNDLSRYDLTTDWSQTEDDASILDCAEIDRGNEEQQAVLHPIIHQFKVAIVLCENGLLPVLRAEIEHFRFLEHEWTRDFELRENEDGIMTEVNAEDVTDSSEGSAGSFVENSSKGSVENSAQFSVRNSAEVAVKPSDADSVGILKLLMELLRNLREHGEMNESLIGEKFKECEQFLQETKELLTHRHIDEDHPEVDPYEKLFEEEPNKETGSHFLSHPTACANEPQQPAVMRSDGRWVAGGCSEECDEHDRMEHARWDRECGLNSLLYDATAHGTAHGSAHGTAHVMSGVEPTEDPTKPSLEETEHPQANDDETSVDFSTLQISDETQSVNCLTQSTIHLASLVDNNTESRDVIHRRVESELMEQKTQQLIQELETELEHAVNIEDYNRAATLDEKIEELRKNLGIDFVST